MSKKHLPGYVDYGRLLDNLQVGGVMMVPWEHLGRFRTMLSRYCRRAENEGKVITTRAGVIGVDKLSSMPEPGKVLFVWRIS